VTNPLSPKRFSLRTLALLAALALGASACGSGSDAEQSEDTSSTTTDAIEADRETTTVEPDDSETSADESSSGEASSSSGRVRLGSSVLAETLDPENQATSARFTGVLNFAGTDDDNSVEEMSMSFEGAYDLASDSTSVTIDLSSMLGAMGDDELGPLAAMGGMDEPMRMISVGEQSWMQWGLFTAMGVEADQWVALDTADAATMTEGFGAGGATDPTEFLEKLEDANAEIEEVGSETVRGVETTHIKALVDMAELAETLPPEEAADLDDVIGAGIDELPMEFWVGDDGLIYRWSMALDMSNMPAAAGMGLMTIVYELFDHGQDVGIVAPDPALVVSGDKFGF
jgi:hypothetical protein